MERLTRKLELVQPTPLPKLGELIHEAVRSAIEMAVEEELATALGTGSYQRAEERVGYRHGHRERTLTGPTGPATISVPRARIATKSGTEEWSSKILPRYSRRLNEINEAILMTYLGGQNTRRIRGALRPLLKAAPLSRSSVSRIVEGLKGSLATWRSRRLDTLDVVYLYLDGFCLRVRRDGKVDSTPVLVAVAVLADGQKQLVSLEMCTSESSAAWDGFLTDLANRGLAAPRLCIIDGNAALRGAVRSTWPESQIQRCTVHKLRNLERKAPAQSYEEIKDDYHAIVYAKTRALADEAWERFEKKWSKRCPMVVETLNEGGRELLTFFGFPEAQWKTLRTTNVIERLNGEFRRRVKTQASLPNDTAAEVLLFALVATGQVRLRKIDGHEKILEVLRRSPEQRAAA
jgi:transposase-like protein